MTAAVAVAVAALPAGIGLETDIRAAAVVVGPGAGVCACRGRGEPPFSSTQLPLAHTLREIPAIAGITFLSTGEHLTAYLIGGAHLVLWDAPEGAEH